MTTAPQATPTDADEERPAAPVRARRRFLPRFGLRSLFVVALLFCLVSAWVGRSLYEVRQDEAAFEALQRAGATIYLVPASKDDPLARSFGVQPYEHRAPSLVTQALGLAERPRLEQVSLSDAGVEMPTLRAALAALARFPELRSVTLQGPAFDDRACEAVAKVRDLEILQLTRCRVSGAGIERLATLDRLRMLWLDEVRDRGDALASLSKASSLRDVLVKEMPLSRAELAAICSLPKLDSLSLVYPPLRGEQVFADLPSAKSLKTLVVRLEPMQEEALGDELIQSVATLPRLERLSIAVPNEEGLTKLAEVSSLRSFDAFGDLPDAALLAFSAKVPECVVQWNSYVHDRHFRGGKEIDFETAMQDYWKQPSRDDEETP